MSRQQRPRYGCYLCSRSYFDHRECQRHFRQKHSTEFQAHNFDRSRCRIIPPAIPPAVPATSAAPAGLAASTPSTVPAVSVLQAAPEPTPAPAPAPATVSVNPIQDITSTADTDMAESSGRGHREKIPSAKIKEQVHKFTDKVESSASKNILPTYIAGKDPRFEQEQKEIPKILDHTKIGPNGEKTEWFSLGNHVESKDKRCYVRAKRDPGTLYFHTAEAPPLNARLSDENHPQCAIDYLQNTFSKDMLSKSGENGHYTTRANVFAREGQHFFEAKVLAIAPPREVADSRALATIQNPDRTITSRGGLRVGLCRREAWYGEALGSSAYSYAVTLTAGALKDYGSARFQTNLRHVRDEDGNKANLGDLKIGDVVGLMITLPSLEVHKKVVEGTFNPAEYPDLKCGPAKPKAKGKPTKKKDKSSKDKDKDKDKEVETNKGKGKAVDESQQERNLIRSALVEVTGNDIPIDHDIVRDRNPFIHKNGPCYFESPEYSIRPDLDRPMSNVRQKSINPETGARYLLDEEAHPQHEIPHFRTLPGSKIEVWKNGKYHGVVWEHLLAFLPPASHIEKSRTSTSGEVDDGTLGYYPAITHYTGGAVECKFDEPWFYGYNDGPPRPNARAFGARYNEQIVEDVMADIVDEVYLERLNKDPEWMKKAVMNARTSAKE